MKRLVLVFAILLPLGCTDANRSRIAAYGQTHTVEMYSGGTLVREWTSTGKVHEEADSDGYYFTDAKTGVLVRVSGDVVITAGEKP